ncbi:hypothetical protein [Fusibacter sp. 3D3]|nr:hypothetical protein [Fusibacter sp. 3D3]GAU79907.1 hypothetical protein F3D3_4572 [Fusibacter sp. 3D3]
MHKNRENEYKAAFKAIAMNNYTNKTHKNSGRVSAYAACRIHSPVAT